MSDYLVKVFTCCTMKSNGKKISEIAIHQKSTQYLVEGTAKKSSRFRIHSCYSTFSPEQGSHTDQLDNNVKGSHRNHVLDALCWSI